MGPLESRHRRAGGIPVKVLRIRLLGEFSLVYGDEPVTTVNTARMQSLLSYLVLHRDAPQARHHLAYQFWPDSAEPQARTNLRKLFHYLHQALPDAECFLCADTHTLQWRPEAPFFLDVAEFESAASMVASPQALRQAVALYRGDLLPSCYEDWILPERERLRQIYFTAVHQLGDLLGSQGRWDEVIAVCNAALLRDTTWEPAYRLIMQAYAAKGNQAQVVQTYQRCWKILWDELGVEPSLETRDLLRRLTA
jgi:DNA-binding SARP family transcriptional activator